MQQDSWLQPRVAAAAGAGIAVHTAGIGSPANTNAFSHCTSGARQHTAIQRNREAAKAQIGWADDAGSQLVLDAAVGVQHSGKLCVFDHIRSAGSCLVA